MITITQRDCRLGAKYAGRHYEANDTKPERQTLKVQLEGIEIDESEFNALFQDAHAYQLLHDTASGSAALKLLAKFELKGLTFEGANVTLWHSLGAQKIEIQKAKLSKLTLTLGDEAASGRTTLGVTIEGEPPLNKHLVELLSRVGSGIEIEIRSDHPDAQEDLPLNKHGTGEQPERGRRGKHRGNGKNHNGRARAH